MDEIRKNLERVEKRMVGSHAAVEANLAAQGAAIQHLAEGQKGLTEGQRGLAEGQKGLAAAVRALAEAQDRLGEAVGRLDGAVGRLDRAVTELQRSGENLRASYSEYRKDSDEMFGHLKAAVFVLESSNDLRFQKIEARLDDLERRPPAA